MVSQNFIFIKFNDLKKNNKKKKKKKKKESVIMHLRKWYATSGTEAAQAATLYTRKL